MATLASLAIGCVGVESPPSDRHPSWAYDATIYELNMRQATPEGSFNAAREQLPRLKELGVDIVWVMPIQPIGVLQRKGSMGSYYAISDYTGVNAEYGTLDELKAYVDEAHNLGMKVILDWVANHTSPDAKWTQNEGWHKRDGNGELAVQYDWYDITELNYENADMRRAMIDAMRYWVEEVDFDGFRCDMAMLVPTPFWEEAVAELKQIKPDLFMLAEAEEVDLTQSAFNMYFGWSMHHFMNGIAVGENSVRDLWNNYNERVSKFGVEAIPMMFTSNHDENSHAGTVFERLGDAVPTMAAFTYLIPSMPLIYTGQEVGNTKQLEFFEKDNVVPSENPEFYTALYRDLDRLRSENRALWSGEKGGAMVEIPNSQPDKLFSMVRSVEGNSVVAVINFSPEPLSVTLEGAESSFAGRYNQFQSSSQVTLSEGMTLELQPWEYKIYYQ